MSRDNLIAWFSLFLALAVGVAGIALPMLGCSNTDLGHALLLLAGALVLIGVWPLLRRIKLRSPLVLKIEIKEIVNQPFRNTRVLLDGYRYVRCTFTHVTFVYNNGETGGFDAGCQASPSCKIASDEPRIQQLLRFLNSAGLLKDNVLDEYSPNLEEP